MKKRIGIYMGITIVGVYIFLTFISNNKLIKTVSFKKDSNLLKEEEITYESFCFSSLSLPLKIQEKLFGSKVKKQKLWKWKEYYLKTKEKLEPEVKQKFWKECLKAKFISFSFNFLLILSDFRFDVFFHKELLQELLRGFDFYVSEEYYIPFLKKIKIYEIIIFSIDIIPPIYRTELIIGVQNNKVFNLNYLPEFNNLIREEKIWIDTHSKAIKYVNLFIKLFTNYTVVNSLDEFINESIVHQYDEFAKRLIYYETVQEYAKARPKKYKELLNHKSKIKSPQVVKETKYKYEIIMYANEILEKWFNKREETLVELKLIIYKNGEINLKKKYLVRGLREWKPFIL